MNWDEKKIRLKQVSEEVGGKFRIEEFSDGNKRMVVEVRDKKASSYEEHSLRFDERREQGKGEGDGEGG